MDYGANFDWQSMMKKKCSDTGFMHLVRSIQERGWLSAIGWDDGWITEGHHRLCAAILLCMDEIPCTVAGTDWYANKKNRQGRISGHGNLDDPEGCYL